SIVFSFFYATCDHPHLHSFPTRRSSDLWASSPAALRRSWCSSLPGGTGLSSPLPGVIVFVGAPAPGANSVARLLARWVSSPAARSEEHTSELQSRENLVCRLLLEKKKQN